MGSTIVKSVQITAITVQLERSLDRSVLIELTVDRNESRSVQLKRGEMPVGSHSLHPPLYLRHGSILHLQIREKRVFRGDRILTHFLSSENIWLASSQSVFDDRTKNFPIYLKDPKKHIWLNVVEVPSTRSPETSYAGQRLPVTENVSLTKEEEEAPLRAASQNVMQKLGELKMALERLGWDKHIVESVKFEWIVSQLCPSSKAVFDSVNAFYEKIKTQGEGDRELLALAMSMERIVNLIQPVKDIAELKELKKTLEIFADLMTKTVDLIETWAKQSVLGNSVLTQSSNGKIDDLKKRYSTFEKEFGRGLQIDAVNKYTFLKPQELKELKDILLNGIKTVSPKAVPCIPGTRTTILEEMETRIDNHDGANILWIRGAPGSGKSSLSLTAKSWLFNQGRLVAYYRFDRNESATTTAIALWRRVAYNLACQFPAVGTGILQKLRDPNFEFDSPTTVFTSLVETPLSELINLPSNKPLVIVIDALDECGGYDGQSSWERKQLLQTLRRWSRLPKHFKLLVTSREESDIIRALLTISSPIHIHSGTHLVDDPRHPASIAASEDIRTFLEHRFSEIRMQLRIVGYWPHPNIIGIMVHRAAGNFMWATAAANFIEKGLNPQDRLHRIMSDASLSSSMNPLYSLYCTILETAFGEFDDSETATLRAVLGTMLCAKRTLSDDEYIKLPTEDSISIGTLESIRYSLGSVIVTDGNLRPVHKSFDDFLCSVQCPPKYAVNIDGSHHLLANLCLTTMETKLRFNLCDLETSCLKNKDVPDIKTKVATGIPPLLSYSCSFWADHLSLAPSDQHLMSKTKAMVLDKLLYWFEAMSLLKEIHRVSFSLLLVLKWFHSSPDDEFKEFISDARRFIAAFGGPIAQSAPHIYISALPFAPEHSSVAQHYLPRFPWTLALTVGKPTDWSPCIFSLKPADNKGYITSITLSPDEKYLASGALEGKIFISDSDTGNLVFDPFEVPPPLLSVFFEPDGRYVWAACDADRLVGFDVETGEKYHDFKVPRPIGCCRCNGDQYFISVEEGIVTLWSADTGRRLYDLSMGIRDYLATFSPNDRYIASVADDWRTIGMWRLVDGREIKLVREPSIGQPQSRGIQVPSFSEFITALSFSVDSNFVVGGSDDGTIRIWDATAGNTVGTPLSTGRCEVAAVAYSDENRRLISLNTKSFATVWNTTTCKVVLGPLRHITSIALSRDGRTAFLGTWQGEVTKWDLDRKGNVPTNQSYDPYTDWVTHFAFSPCRTKLASLHPYSTMIHFWDMRTYEPLPETIKIPRGHLKIIFTPDGSQVVTCDDDAGVWVWNAGTGELAFRHKFDSVVIHMTFRSTDQQLVACSEHGVVYLWNLEDSAPPLIVTILPRILALSPDGLTLVVRDDNRTPRHYMWSTTAHQPLPLTFTDYDNVEDHTDAYYSSTEPSVTITSYKANSNDLTPTTLRVWSTQTGELTAGPLTIHNKISRPTCSYNNSHIAFSLGSVNHTTIWIWNALANCPISTFWTTHISGITALDFSPEGELLVSGSFDGQIRFWSTADLLGGPPVPVEFMHGGMDIRDGWVMFADEKLGFWVPPYHREKLAWNGIVAIIGGEHSGIPTHVDLTKFRYGANWIECFGEAK